MKKIVLACLILTVLLIVSLANAASNNVRGYWRDSNHDGIKDTYVEPYQRTNPNSSRTDNYGYPGHYNPNTGQQTPYSTSPREMYPTNPNPYEKKQGGLGW